MVTARRMIVGVEDQEPLPSSLVTDLTVHPVLRAIMRDGEPTPTSVTGYVGPNARDGYVTVYPNLTDLTRSYEVATVDVLHVEAVPESVRPFGAQVLWLRGNAEIGFRNTALPATPAAHENGVAEDRLGLEVLAADDGGRHCTCRECTVCNSHCDTTCVSGGDCMYPPPVTLEA